MSKSKLTMILYAFMGCLVLTIVILSIKVITKPKKPTPVTEVAQKTEQNTPTKVETPATDPTDAEDTGEDVTDEPVVEEPKTVTKQVVVLKDPNVNVNVRAEANTDCRKLGQIAKDEQYDYVEGIDTDWTKIIYKGSEAYVSSGYVKVIEVEVPAEE